SINANVALWDLSPVASEIEAQTIRWIAELVGYKPDCGGLMVSGGNMANILAFLAARRAKTSDQIRTAGLRNDPQRLTVYCASETHTWIQKATDISGLGTDSIRWIETDDDQRMNVDQLRRQLEDDLASDYKPFMVIATAGTVSTGAVDPLIAIHRVAHDYDLWFHVDGAYGAPAAALPEADDELKALTLADSIALDPHKWLYAPLEAACTLMRERRHLVDAFTYRPPYYRFDDDVETSGNDYYSLGLQNSRGFRALKVWLALRHCGRRGYVELIRNDITLAQQLFDEAQRHDRLEALTQNLSITTFRFIPAGLAGDPEAMEPYLNELNAALVERLQASGEIYVSNAIVNGRYVLRACLVNFRTTQADIAEVPDIVVRVGTALDAEMRPENLR
ncbi:MAG: pyridoxal phosphate-dependent decarboxylase family protein, partial [Gammaproteobacteria bacterium]